MNGRTRIQMARVGILLGLPAIALSGHASGTRDFPVQTLGLGRVTCLTCLRHSLLLPTAGAGPASTSWKPRTGKPAEPWKSTATGASSVPWSSRRTGRPLARRSTDKAVRVQNVEGGKQIHTLHAHLSRVNSVEFSPDGWTRAAVSAEGDLGSGSRLQATLHLF